MNTDRSSTRVQPAGLWTIIFLAVPVLFGAFLRICNLQNQILLDDEWHSLNFVLGKPFLEIVTTHGEGANCIPQNIINWIWLHTVGWTELLLYLPSVLCGIAGLLLFPWLITRLAGRSVAIFFTWLLAISPCVIFYTRIARPYSMVLFLGFLSLLCLALWVREGRRRFLWTYVVCGTTAIYFHLYAVLPVWGALAALLLLAWKGKRFPQTPWITLRPLAVAGIVMLLSLLGLLGPAHWSNPWWLRALGQRSFTYTGLWNFFSLLAVSRFILARVLFIGAVFYGLNRWMRKDFQTALVFLSSWVAFFLLIVVSTQDNMHAAIQIARYNIVLFPVAMLLAAVGLEQVLERLPSVFPEFARPALGVLLIAVLLIGSPLWRTYARPNNFMHHSAFQDSYAPMDWSKSRVRLLSPMPQMDKDRIPGLYFDAALLKDVAGIIEYPMFVGDPVNFYYFYQHYHRKPVTAGYYTNLRFEEPPFKTELVHQLMAVDYVMGRASKPEAERMWFRNVVSLSEPAELSRTHRNWLIVVHKDLFRETMDIGFWTPEGAYLPSLAVRNHLLRHLGNAIFSDDQVMAWKVP